MNPSFPTKYKSSDSGSVARRAYDKLADVVSVKDFGATGNTKTVTDAAMTSASATLTSATAAFVAADVGKRVNVVGAGAAGATLAGTITARSSSTQVTLSVSAGTTVSNARAAWGTDDTAFIQAAITALAGLYKTLYFPPGVYWCSDTLNVRGGNFAMLGAGRYSSVLRTEVFDAGTSTVTDPLILVQGLPISTNRLTNVQIVDLGIDATSRGTQAIAANNLGNIRFDYCDDVHAKSLYQTGGHNFVDFGNTTHAQVSDLHCVNNEEGVVTIFTGCADFVVNDILALDVDEVVDMYNTDRIVISGVRAKGISGSTQEAFDVSSCRDVSISDVVCDGFYTGIHPKCEGGVAWSGLRFNNVHFRHFTGYGFYCEASGATGDDMRVTNFTCVSTNAATIGVFDSVTGSDHVFSGGKVKTPGNGMELKAVAGFVVTNCDVESTGEHGLYIWTTPARPRVFNNRLTGGSGSLKQALQIDAATYALVESNTIVAAPAGDGILLNNCLYPRVHSNRILAAGRNAIALTYSDTSGVDSTNFLLGFVVDDNECRNYGSSSASKAGINVNMNMGTNQTGTYNMFSVSKNRFLRDATVSANAQYGILIARGSLTGMDYGKVDNNLGYKLPNGNSIATGTAPNTTTSGNAVAS